MRSRLFPLSGRASSALRIGIGAALASWLADASVPSDPPTALVGYRPLLLDVDLTMRSGAETMATLQQALARFEDQHLRVRWFDETGVPREPAGVSGRLAKLALLDAPVDHLVVVLAHEYVGHGVHVRTPLVAVGLAITSWRP